MDKCYGIIYKATNKINGKIYIGQTIRSLDKRISDHIGEALLEKDNMYFHKAIRKYGKENFKWKIIKECNSLEELNKAEIETIEKYDAFGNGYNLTKGGEGQSGFKHSEETKKKLSDINKGNHHTKEARKKMSEARKGENNPWYGKHHTEESKRKMSKARRGKKHYNYGKRLSKKTRKRMSNAKIGRQIGNKSPKAKKYILITPDNEGIIIHGIRDFCRHYEEKRLDYRRLIKVAKGRLKQYKGYKCEYSEGNLDVKI